MLLFVRRQYVEQIRAGLKTFEIRAGAKYRGVREGDSLSINGQFRLIVTRVEEHTRGSLLTALPDWADAVESCYPGDVDTFYVFHFKPPTDAAPRPAA